MNEIARHYVEAKQPALALPYIVKSGDRAARSGARDEAIGYYRQVIDIAIALDEHAYLRKAYEGLGKTLEFAMRPTEAIDAYKAMQVFADEHEDIGMQVSALNKMSYTYSMVLGQMQEAKKCLAEAEELARKHEQVGGLIEATTVRCGICAITADFAGAAKHLAEAARLGREIEDKETTAFGLAHRANMLAHQAHFDEAYETAQECLVVSDEAHNLERRADVLAYPIPLYHMHKGDLEGAYKSLEEAYTLAARIGASIPTVISSYLLGQVTEMQGNYEAAMEWHRKGLRRAPTGRFPALLAGAAVGWTGRCVS